MVTIKVRKVGNSLGVILPSEALQLLRVKEGESLHLTETPDGVLVTSYDPEFETAMNVGERFMARYRNTLRELSK
jgi:putative addiction module antidote